MKKLYFCSNEHTYYNMKFCPSCFKKSKYYFCQQCLNMAPLLQEHNCSNQIKYIIEVKKLPYKFEALNENVVKTIKRLFGKCQYYRVEYLDMFIVNCGQRFYNVHYFDEYLVKKIDQVIYNKVPFEQWEKNDVEFYPEYDGSNLIDTLEKHNHLFIYETLRKSGITSIFEFLCSYPIFNQLKQKINEEYQVPYQFVHYDNDFNNVLCKVASFFVKKPKKLSLLTAI
jgi:hypothetical protein